MYLSNLKWRLQDNLFLKQMGLHRLSLCVLCLLVLSGCFSSHEPAEQVTTVADESIENFDDSNDSIRPLPQSLKLDPKRVVLGKVLFHDTRLSKDNSISCASCHSLDKGGTDNLARSVGINGAIGYINAPTVLNSGFNFVQFWDGRAATLEEQATGPIHNTTEMGSNWQEVINKLSSDRAFIRKFRKVYKDGLTSENIQDAIAIYERALITPNSPFDRFLRGDESVIKDEAIEGYYLFKDYGCDSCHQGVNIGGNMYQRLGVMDDYFKDRGNITKEDYGRFNVTGRESDKFKFKVPSLRNVALTAPYFHDGTAATLHDAVTVMMRYQIGMIPDKKHVYFLVAFLESLTGELEVSLK
jgi:cytochrome c peroxidase